MSIAALRREFEESGSIQTQRALKNALCKTRGEYILANMSSSRERGLVLLDLAKHTYQSARRLGDTELMDWAERELIDGLGLSRASRVIENLRMKAEIEMRSGLRVLK